MSLSKISIFSANVSVAFLSQKKCMGARCVGIFACTAPIDRGFVLFFHLVCLLSLKS